MCCSVAYDLSGVGRYYIVPLGKMETDKKLVELAAHEATHVWQAVKCILDIEREDDEIQAYAIGNITAAIVDAYKRRSA